MGEGSAVRKMTVQKPGSLHSVPTSLSALPQERGSGGEKLTVPSDKGPHLSSWMKWMDIVLSP